MGTRSKIVGIGGLFVVAGLTVYIGFEYGQGSNPRGAMAAILGIVFAYVAILLVTQRLDHARAAAKDEREALSGPSDVEDPTRLSAAQLTAAMAVKPVSAKALEARRGMWAIASSSIGSVAVLMILIGLFVVPWQVFQETWSIIVVGPILGLYIIFLAVRAIGSGGTVDRAYAFTDAMIEPLGLGVDSHPEIGLRPRFDRAGYSPELRGTLALSGTRHGRTVRVNTPAGGATVTTVEATVPTFEVRAKGERLRAPERAPAAVREVVSALRASSRWKGVVANGHADGISVTRARDGGGEWLCDLWLAERLAERLGKRAG